MKKHWIFMADIADSSSQAGDPLMKRFSELVSGANVTFKKGIVSPLSITLGDEFQGIVDDFSVIRDLIFWIDEKMLGKEPFFRLRFVANYGEIDTPVNHETAYGMLGKGLTEARELLNSLKKSDEDVTVSGLGDVRKERLIILAFRWYRSVYNGWPEKDREVAADFLKYTDYKEVARRHDRDASSMWRKGHTLQITDFLAAREMITLLTDNGNMD